MSSLPIPIPQGYILLVKASDIVKPGHVLAKRGEDNSREKTIPLAGLLGVSPKKVAKTLRKDPGDSIKEGEVIATKPSLLSVTEVVSSVSGTFLRLERDSGSIVVEVATTTGEIEGPAEIISPFEGTVASVSTEGIVLSTTSGGMIVMQGMGGTSKGELLVVKGDKGQEHVVDASLISVHMIDNIVLGMTFTREALVKASGMGVGGVIALKILKEDTELLVEKKMLFPIAVVDEKTWLTLAKSHGKQVYLDADSKTILVS